MARRRACGAVQVVRVSCGTLGGSPGAREPAKGGKRVSPPRSDWELGVRAEPRELRREEVFPGELWVCRIVTWSDSELLRAYELINRTARFPRPQEIRPY